MDSFLNFLDTAFLIFKIIAGIVSVLLIWAILQLMEKIGYFSHKISYGWNVYKFGADEKKRIPAIWRAVLEDVKTGNPDYFKRAIETADKMLDEVLKVSGYKGANRDERINSVDASAIPLIETVKEMRRQVLPLMNNLDERTTKEALQMYREVFRFMGLLH
jgi:hypothetical protein